MWKSISLLSGVAASSLAVACASGQQSRPAAAVAAPAASASPAVPNSFSLETATAAARRDAAAKTGVAAADLVLISAESVTWPDGSLGCPMPGMLYPQALVPGFRIRLQGPTGELDYHASTRGGLVLCPAKRATMPAPGGGFNSSI